MAAFEQIEKAAPSASDRGGFRLLCAFSCFLDILSTAKAGGFLDTDGICLLKCRSYDTSPKKVDAPTFKMFFVAFQ